MNFDYNKKSIESREQLQAFMAEHIFPNEKEYENWVLNYDNLWQVWPGMEGLKTKAKTAGLWNLFLPKEYGNISPGLTNLEYASLAEIMGRATWSSEVFNCNAPDTGNMEVLAKYGNEKQKQEWLTPLLAGKIRSAFLMTEPEVASSDATNIKTSIKKEGDEYIINGRKWWSTGAMNNNCELFIVMGKTDEQAEKHRQQSMVIVPRNTPGVEIIRPLYAMGMLDSPGGHAEIKMDNVRVPADNLILGVGRGFEIAQGRLGPGRIHHCMRLIGMAQRTLELMCKRVEACTAFGRPLSKFSSIRQDIALSQCEIQQARLLTLEAADRIDKYGIKGAKEHIAMIKIVAPKMVQTVTDRAMQIFGGAGLSHDTPIYGFHAWARILRMADGPDEVHMFQLGRDLVRKYGKI